MKISLTFLLSLLAPVASSFAAEIIKPGEPFDYPKGAFYPDRWEKVELDIPMTPWEGEHVVFVANQGENLDPKVMTEFIANLDSAWNLYHELTGYTPKLLKHYNKKSTIVALPANHLSCGYGCGYVGGTGIEMTRFYDDHYQLLEKNAKNIPHCYFYEMGRNYFGFGHKHSAFTTGFAVFMRYVCIDTLKYHDRDQQTARIIEQAIDLWEKSEISFIGGFTEHGGKGEKGSRLFDEAGKPIRPSDQNVLYASLMLKLRKEYGGDDFVKRFYQQITDCPEIRPVSAETARKQCLSLLVSASIAAKKDLTPLFCDKYRLALPEETCTRLGKILWEKEGLKSSQVLLKL